MAPVDHVQPDHLADTGGRYTHVIKAGDWVFISGQTPSDQRGNVVGGGNPAAQAEQVFRNLRHAIESVGGGLPDIIKMTIYVVGREHMEAVRTARRGHFHEKPPASTLVLVAGLARAEFLLEIDAVAYLGR